MTTGAKTRRQESSWVIRLGLIAAVIGVLVVIVSVVVYFVDRSSRNGPLNVAAYSDAQLIGTTELGEGHDRVSYVSAAPIDEVAAFYQRELGSENCVRLENSVQEPGLPDVVYRCYADRSSLYITQATIVTIQPGMENFAGQTVIIMDRTWGQ